ncbi:MAG: TolC family protein [Cyanobacteriota/Melainabacteria group bacterium]
MKASVHALKGSINDVLLQATNLYYELVLNDALLQIRVKAVEESKAILQLNEDLFAEGVATKLDVLHRTQLSRQTSPGFSTDQTKTGGGGSGATALI